MLPLPTTSGRRKGFKRVDLPRRKLSTVLLSRSRATNLGVVLLGLITLFSLYHNLRSFFTSCSYSYEGPSYLQYEYNYTGHAKALWATITRSPALESLEHLIIVPGHAIWKGHDPSRKLNDEEWILEPYQKGKKRTGALVEHIYKGAELVLKDEHSLLVYSGGQTRLRSPMTEAQSYLRLALSSNLFNTSDPELTFMRVTTEDYALDSFQNLLFSIARFKEYTGRYPDKITVVGYQFKRSRFVELHRAALRWPKDRFEYIGMDPDDQGHIQVATEGERENGYIPYSRDAYGCHSVLLDKRRRRNPFHRLHSYYIGAPELNRLFDWCPSLHNGEYTTPFPGKLPWDII